MGQENLLKP